jgi:hypothetical protein
MQGLALTNVVNGLARRRVGDHTLRERDSTRSDKTKFTREFRRIRNKAIQRQVLAMLCQQTTEPVSLRRREIACNITGRDISCNIVEQRRGARSTYDPLTSAAPLTSSFLRKIRTLSSCGRTTGESHFRSVGSWGTVFTQDQGPGPATHGLDGRRRAEGNKICDKSRNEEPRLRSTPHHAILRLSEERLVRVAFVTLKRWQFPSLCECTGRSARNFLEERAKIEALFRLLLPRFASAIVHLQRRNLFIAIVRVLTARVLVVGNCYDSLTH